MSLPAATAETNAAKTPVVTKEKKPHRWRPGTVALREIKKYQSGKIHPLPRAPLERQIREMLEEDAILRFKKESISVLRQARDSYAADIFAMSYLLAVGAKDFAPAGQEELGLLVCGGKNIFSQSEP